MNRARSIIVITMAFLLLPCGLAFSWGGGTHRRATREVIEIFKEMFPQAYESLFYAGITDCFTPSDYLGPVIYDIAQNFYSVGGVGDLGEGAGVAFANFDQNPRLELILMAHDAPDGPNNFRYKIIWNLDKNCQSTYSRTYIEVPGVTDVGEGAGIAITNLDRNPRPEMVLMAHSGDEGPNTFRYRIGWNIGKNGRASQWSDLMVVPGVTDVGEGAGVAFVSLDDDPRPEMVLMAYSADEGQNSFRYKIGWNVDGSGKATWDQSYVTVRGLGDVGEGAGLAFTNLDSDPRPEMVLMAHDAPPGMNHFRYKIGWNVQKSGQATRWTSFLVEGACDVGEGAGIDFANLDSDPRPEVVLMAYSADEGPNAFRYKIGWNMDATGGVAAWTGGNEVPLDPVERLVWEAAATDEFEDLELVNVEGTGEGRDDPHIDNVLTARDYDDFIGSLLIDSSYIGKGRISHTFAKLGEKGEYTLEFEVYPGTNLYELLLRIDSFTCLEENESGEDEIYLLLNGYRIYSNDAVDAGDRFELEVPAASFYSRAYLELYEEDDGPGEYAIDDVPHHLEEENDWLSAELSEVAGFGAANVSAFSHFIDIDKGRGIYDDYDGYSFMRGSGRKAEDEVPTVPGEVVTAILSGVATLLGTVISGGVPVPVPLPVYIPGEVSLWPIDDMLMWWYNDEYIHIPEYYPAHYDPTRCSPAVERYCRYSRGNLAERFPLAESTGEEGLGIPYTVFPPADNMARYWFDVFLNPPAGRKPNVACLGPVLHAVQDASVPHHAFGCLGNYHADYEDILGSYCTNRCGGWLRDQDFLAGVKQLVQTWDRQDPTPPATNTYYDRTYFLSHNPAINWPIDQLVTWMAVQAWNSMHPPGEFEEDIARPLTQKAMAMSVLILKKAATAIGSPSSRRPQPPGPEPSPSPLQTSVTSVCSLRISHLVVVTWNVQAGSGCTVSLELTDPGGETQTYQTSQTSGTHTFEVSYPEGGAATVKITVSEPGKTSSTSTGVWLPPCEG